ncbi:hypothetical protein B0T11DRAFT_70540 [Plectosphaerella cucumerina]|uniref:Uncharacterized protein n=1 Tax=Plectosphaerella cucumerina TaxID=40658 RepID=A0A8K0TT07_9PEZI|nr:hypothetical protein B0T11DRAFT_70540 [Plectosphaerella cucumerina]
MQSGSQRNSRIRRLTSHRLSCPRVSSISSIIGYGVQFPRACRDRSPIDPRPGMGSSDTCTPLASLLSGRPSLDDHRTRGRPLIPILIPKTSLLRVRALFRGLWLLAWQPGRQSCTPTIDVFSMFREGATQLKIISSFPRTPFLVPARLAPAIVLSTVRGKTRVDQWQFACSPRIPAVPSRLVSVTPSPMTTWPPSPRGKLWVSILSVPHSRSTDR